MAATRPAGGLSTLGPIAHTTPSPPPAPPPADGGPSSPARRLGAPVTAFMERMERAAASQAAGPAVASGRLHAALAASEALLSASARAGGPGGAAPRPGNGGAGASAPEHRAHSEVALRMARAAYGAAAGAAGAGTPAAPPAVANRRGSDYYRLAAASTTAAAAAAMPPGPPAPPRPPPVPSASAAATGPSPPQEAPSVTGRAPPRAEASYSAASPSAAAAAPPVGWGYGTELAALSRQASAGGSRPCSRGGSGRLGSAGPSAAPPSARRGSAGVAAGEAAAAAGPAPAPEPSASAAPSRPSSGGPVPPAGASGRGWALMDAPPPPLIEQGAVMHGFQVAGPVAGSALSARSMLRVLSRGLPGAGQPGAGLAGPPAAAAAAATAAAARARPSSPPRSTSVRIVSSAKGGSMAARADARRSSAASAAAAASAGAQGPGAAGASSAPATPARPQAAAPTRPPPVPAAAAAAPPPVPGLAPAGASPQLAARPYRPPATGTGSFFTSWEAPSAYEAEDDDGLMIAAVLARDSATASPPRARAPHGPAAGAGAAHRPQGPADDDDDDDDGDDGDGFSGEEGSSASGSSDGDGSSEESAGESTARGGRGRGRGSGSWSPSAPESVGTAADSATSILDGRGGGPSAGKKKRRGRRKAKARRAAASDAADGAGAGAGGASGPAKPAGLRGKFEALRLVNGRLDDPEACQCERCAASDWCDDAAVGYRLRQPSMPGLEPTVAVFTPPSAGPDAPGLLPEPGSAGAAGAPAPVRRLPRLYVKLTGIANGAVRHSFRHAGFRRTQGDGWNALWCYPPRIEEFKALGLNRYQKVNHFPGTWELGRKDRLARHLARQRRRLGAVMDIMPRTFMLPADWDEFRADCERRPDEVYIMKPCGSSRGRGIRVLKRPDKRGAPPEVPRDKKDLLVQRYLLAPKLIDGYKFDLRIYVLVTSVDPLRVYVYNEGLVRFATEPYRTDARSLRHKCMHLTNFSVNRKSAAFVANTDADADGQGSKWSLSALRRRYAAEGKSFAPVWAQVRDVVVKTMAACEQVLNTCVKAAGGPACFELFGFDIVLDAADRAWLLEVNTCPALESPSPLDKRIKHALVANVLDLVGFTPYSQRRFAAEQEARKQARLLGQGGGGLGGSYGGGGAAGGGSFGGAPGGAGAGKPPKRDLLSLAQLSFAGVPAAELPLVVRESEAERARAGGFERVFPAASAAANEAYLALFETQRYSNLLLHKYLCHQQKYTGSAAAAAGGAGSRPGTAPMLGGILLGSGSRPASPGGWGRMSGRPGSAAR